MWQRTGIEENIMSRYMSERERDAWYQFLTAVETNDCATVQRMRGQFTDQKLGTQLVGAARFNSVEVVAELLTNPKQDILMYVHDAVMKSTERGNTDVLRIVLQHADPTRVECFSLALWGALVHNHPPCVDILFDWIDVDYVLRIAHERGARSNAAFATFEQKIAERQNALLTNEIVHTHATRGTRKM